MIVVMTAVIARGQKPGMQQVLAEHLRGTPASAVWLSVPTGKVEGAFGDLRVEALPGSVVKPFVLWAALNRHVVSEHTAMACSGNTVVGGHNLACTHPRSVMVPDARQALAYSCNSYFAAVARHLNGADLRRDLSSEGFQVSALPATPDARVLLVLGLADITITPEALANGYRRLALAMDAGGGANGKIVRDGLLDSVRSGMAHAALTDGVNLAGKTGSAHDQTPAGQHGWFAGIVFDRTGTVPEHVLVVYLPGGNGNDAAGRAHAILEGVDR